MAWIKPKVLSKPQCPTFLSHRLKDWSAEAGMEKEMRVNHRKRGGPRIDTTIRSRTDADVSNGSILVQLRLDMIFIQGGYRLECSLSPQLHTQQQTWNVHLQRWHVFTLSNRRIHSQSRKHDWIFYSHSIHFPFLIFSLYSTFLNIQENPTISLSLQEWSCQRKRLIRTSRFSI